MQIFKLNKEYFVVCEWQSTRSGFRHMATIIRNGQQIGKTKCTYLNRTWERYQFQSVLQKALEIIETTDISKNLLTRFRKRVNQSHFN